MFKKLFLVLFVAFLLLAGIVLVNTFRFSSDQTSVEYSPSPELSENSLKNLQKAIRFKTISFGDSTLFDSTQFLGFQKFLKNTYPLSHEKLDLEIVEKHSLLYHWEGKNKNLKPIILMAHQDVVPIEGATADKWTVDPFGGEVKENFIWGRGTTDDKMNVISIFETVEKLLSENFTPERTIYLAFGHDEEIGGKGAIAMAALLKSRNILAELILDEGGIITKEKIPGITKPVALLGTSEKGYLSLELTAEKNGGHSSMPDKETSIDILTKALVKLREDSFDPEFSESMNGFIENVGPELPFVQKMAFANPWLFKSLIVGSYEKSGPGNAMIRTTIVPTILTAGIKDNVVPTVAKATINLRLLPGNNSVDIIEKIKRLINDDRISITVLQTRSEASPVTPVKSFGYKMVEASIKKSYPQVISSPFLVIGATDSRHFVQISSNIIKFSPMIDPIGFHGIDERVSLESYKTTLWFYEQLIRNASFQN